MSLTDRTVSGITWSVLSRFGQEAIGLSATFILARLLSPDTYGLLGMVTVFTGFIGVFQDLGLGASIIQDRTTTQEDLSGIFWLNLGFSVLLGLVTVAAGPFIARFYDEPSIMSIAMVLALGFPLSGIAVVPGALLAKDMDFRKLAVVGNGSLLIGSVVGILAAFAGLGVWALVVRRLTATLVGTVLKWALASWKPALVLPFGRIRRQLRFGINVQAGTLLNYGARNGDDLLVGKFLGTEALGVYQMAYRLMLWPLQKVSSVVGQVMFPALATIQDDRARVKRAFLKATRSVAFVTFPMTLGLWIVAPSAIHVFLGEEWQGVIPIFRVLCVLGLTQSIATNTGWIFLSQGRADIRLRLVSGFSALFVVSFLIGLNWGALGVAVCYTIASLIATPIQFRVAGSLVDMSLGDVVGAVTGISGCAIGMALVVWGSVLLLPTDWAPWAYLLVQVPLGIMTYLVLVSVFRISAYQELRALLWGRLKVGSWRTNHPERRH